MLLCKLAVVYEVQVLIYVVIKYNQASVLHSLKWPKHLCNWMAKSLTAVMDRIIIDMFYWFPAVHNQ